VIMTTIQERADAIAWLAAVQANLAQNEESCRASADARIGVSIALDPADVAALIDFTEEN